MSDFQLWEPEPPDDDHDDTAEQSQEDWYDHPSLTAAERNPSLCRR